MHDHPDAVRVSFFFFFFFLVRIHLPLPAFLAGSNTLTSGTFDPMKPGIVCQTLYQISFSVSSADSARKKGRLTRIVVCCT